MSHTDILLDPAARASWNLPIVVAAEAALREIDGLISAIAGHRRPV